MSKIKNRRWRLIADPKIQGALSVRLVIYWGVCQVAMIGTMLFFAYMLDTRDGEPPIDLWRFATPALIVSSLVLPIALFDLIAASNRFAGPLYQIRKRLKDLNENSTCQRMNFRKGDFYPDLRDEFNHVCVKIETQAARIKELEKQLENSERPVVAS